MIKFFIKTLLFISITITSFSLTAKEGYKIKVKINGLSDTSIYLAYHFGDKQYMSDTTRLDSKGVGVFSGDEPLPGGVYLVVLPNKTYFEIIVNEQEFYVENDTADFQKNFKSTGTVENEIFYNDMRFIMEMQKEKQALDSKLKQAKGNKAKEEKIKDQLSQLDDEVKAHRKSIMTEHPNTFYAKFIKSLQEPEIPDPPKKANGEPVDSFFEYKYYKNHYFDNIDFSDDRMLRTPTLYNKVMTYINKVVPQVPDSLNKACDVVLTKAEGNDEMFKYWLITLLNKYANSNIMGMDAVYVHLVDAYYATGKASWTSEDDLYRITDRAKSLEPLLLGKTAPNLFFKDPDNKVIPLHSVKAKYLLVYIYSPDCGHCKKETPLMLKAYKKVVDTLGIDLKVYAVPTLTLFEGKYDDAGKPIFNESLKKEWTDFVEKYKMQRWINVADLYQSDNLHKKFDVQATPTIYLLDKDKKIIAKRFNHEQLVQIIEDMEKHAAN